MFFRRAWIGLTLLLSSVLSVLALDESDFFIFKTFPPRSESELKDWKSIVVSADLKDEERDNCRGLPEALANYEKSPSMKTAIGVLRYYNVLAKNKDLRYAFLGRDEKLFQTLDAAKYELIMRTQIKISERFGEQGGIAFSIRVGSTGKRHKEWIEWRNRGGNFDDMPKLDFNKQFSGDDDITNVPDPKVNENNPVLGELLNGETAREEFIKVTKLYDHEGLDPKAMQVEFLSPSKAYPILRLHQPGEIVEKWPSYLFEWARSNPEKYNGMFAVEQLHAWAEEKGWVTQDVKNPLGTTMEYKKFKGQRGSEEFEFKEFPEGDLFGWVANNHRQIFDVHKGDLKSLAKYTERLIETWEKLKLDPEKMMDGEDIKALASNIANPTADYKVPEGAQAKLEKYIGKLIRDTHLKGIRNLTLHLTDAVSKRSRGQHFEPFRIEELIDANPELNITLNALAVAYTNVDPKLIQELQVDLATMVKETEENENVKPEDYYQAQIAKYLMASVQTALNSAEFSGLQAKSNEFLRGRFCDRINEHLIKISGLNLDHYLLKVAQGDFSQKELRLVWDGNFSVAPHIVERQLKPEDVARDILNLEYMAHLFNWPEKDLAKKVKEYFEGEPETAVKILRTLHEFLDPSKVSPIYIQYKDADGNLVRKAIKPTRLDPGLSLGFLAFKGALKGWSIWGDFDDGKQMFQELNKIYGGGMNREELAKSQAMALSSYLSLLSYLQADRITHDIPMGSTLAQAASLSGEAFTQKDALQDLAFAMMKDLSLLYVPQLAYAYGVWGISTWAWNKYSLEGSRSDLIDLLVENGVWEYDLQGVKLPQLKGFRYYFGNAPPKVENDVKWLARLLPQGPQEGIVLMKSKKVANPREALLDIAYREGKVESDPILEVSLKAVRDLFELSFLKLPILMTDSRDWTAKWLKDSYGITVPTPEDATQVVRQEIQLEKIDIGWSGAFPGAWTDQVSDGVRKNLGYLVSDFWVKRQNLLEGPVLDAVIEEAARRMFKEAITGADKSTYLDEVEKIDQRMMELDKRVWREIARSADPFPGPNYDEKKDIPITRAFQEDTAEHRVRLKNYTERLKGPDPGNEGSLSGATQSPTLDKMKSDAEKIVTEIIKEITNLMFVYEKDYESVLSTLTEANRYVARADSFTIDPYHMRLSPKTARSRETDSAEGWFMTGRSQDITAAENWFKGYKEEYIQVTEDVAAVLNQIGIKPESVNPVFDTLEKTIADWTGEGPAQYLARYHPYWNQLVRLRFQIHTLQNILPNAAEATPEEIGRAVTRMSRKEEPIGPPDLGDPRKRSDFLNELIKIMEDEYLELLKLGLEMFKMTLTIEPQENGVLTDTLKAKVELAVKEEGLDEEAMRKLIKGYRWELVRGGEISDEPAYVDEITKNPEWNTILHESGLQMLRVSVLGDQNLPFSKITREIEILPAQMKGVLEIIGDYPGNPPIKVFLLPVGSLSSKEKGTVTRPGIFEFTLEKFDPSELSTRTDAGPTLNSFESYAEFEGEEGSSSTKSERVLVSLTKGVFTLNSSLILNFPSLVNVKVNVTDASDESVNAQTTVMSESQSDAELPFTLKLKKDDIVWAKAKAQSFPEIEEESQKIKYAPVMGKEITLKIQLPFFDTGHFKVSGRFVSGTGIDPPARISAGIYSPNISTPGHVKQDGSFACVNSKPVPLKEKLTMRALLYGDDDRLFQPVSEIVESVIAKGKELNLGEIPVKPLEVKVKPIRIKVTDWTGEVVKEEGFKVKIGFLDIQRSGDEYEGVWIFTKRNERVMIKAEFRLPDGTTVSGEETFSIDQVQDLFNPKPPPDPIMIKLPIYLPGKLKLTGSTQVIGSGNIPLPDRVTLSNGLLAIQEEVSANSNFEINLSRPVKINSPIAIEGKAQSGNFVFTGQKTANVPSQAQSLDMGIISLKIVVTKIRVPDVKGFLGEEAAQILKNAGLNPIVKLSDPASQSDLENKVKETKPSHPQEVDVGSAIEVLLYGKYQPLAKVPYVIGYPASNAVQTLKIAGFEQVALTIGDPAQTEVQENTVYEQTPGPNDDHDPSVPVRLVIYGKYVPSLVVPDVIGMNYQVAAGILSGKQYTASSTPGEPASTRDQQGIVYTQSPGAGAPLEEGGTVTLAYYSEFIEPEPVRDILPQETTPVVTPQGEARPFYAVMDLYIPMPNQPMPKKGENENSEAFKQRLLSFLNRLTLNDVTPKPMGSQLCLYVGEGAAFDFPRDIFGNGEKFAMTLNATYQTESGTKNFSGTFLLVALNTYDAFDQALLDYPKMDRNPSKIVRINDPSGAFSLRDEKGWGQGNLHKGWSREDLEDALLLLKVLAEMFSTMFENMECFVATAVYGDIHAPQLDILRNFRDEVLMDFAGGRKLIQFYYHYGPGLADKVREHPSIISFLRFFLDRFVSWLDHGGVNHPVVRVALNLGIRTSDKILFMFIDKEENHKSYYNSSVPFFVEKAKKYNREKK